MSEVVFFLTTLHGEDVREAYEAWVDEIDTPLAVALPGVTSYRVVRLEQPVMPGTDVPSYSYIEIIEISDLATYRESIGSTPPSFFEQFGSFIARYEAVAGRVINDLPA